MIEVRLRPHVILARTLSLSALRRAAIVVCVATAFVGEVRASIPAPGEFALEGGSQRPTFESWGDNCPPKPKTTVTRAGAQYALDTSGTLTTADRRAPPLTGADICQRATGLPDLKTRTTSPGNASCATPPGAARRVGGTVTLRALGPNRLEVRHSFDYAWVLDGSACEMSMAARWTLRRKVPIATPDEVAEPAEPCAVLGPLAHLEPVGRRNAHVNSNGRLVFSARALDANGCRLPKEVNWTTTAGEINQRGMFTARGLEPGNEASVTARVEAFAINFHVKVVGPDNAWQGLIEALPEQPPEAKTEGAIDRTGGSAPIVVDAANEPGLDPRWFIALFALLGALAIGLALYVLMRSLSARPAQPSDESPPEDAGPVAVSITHGHSGYHKCSSCERSFERGTRFCPYDGTPLSGD